MNGSLTAVTTNKQYTKYKYTLDSKTYTDIHVFKTLGKAKQSIAPAITTKKTDLVSMEPVCCASADIIAKTNACMHDYNSNKFFGFFYQGAGYPMYINGIEYTSVPEESNLYTEPKFWPSFCVKTDGTASIRWFANKARVEGALPYCKCIIAGVHPIVFNSTNVFKTKVYDNEIEKSMLIYDPAGKVSSDLLRLNANNGEINTSTYRTFIGHKAGNAGIYLMVCAESMNVKVGASLMQDLGCDFAVNMDGRSPVQMRIKSGYGPAGRVVGTGKIPLHTAVCAYLL